MSSSNQQSTSTSTAVGEVGRRVLGTLRLGGRLGLRVGGGALERLRPVVERGLSVSPGTRGTRSSDPPGTPAPLGRCRRGQSTWRVACEAASATR